MANPFLGTASMHTPSQHTDHYGDSDGGWIHGTTWSLAGVLIGALVIIVAMHAAGFRAMVGIGRS